MIYNVQILPTETNFNPTNNTSQMRIGIWLGGYTGTITSSSQVRYKKPGSDTWTNAGSFSGTVISTTNLTEIFSFTTTITHDADGGGNMIVQIPSFTITGHAYSSTIDVTIPVQNLNSNVSTLYTQFYSAEEQDISVAVGTPSLAAITKPIPTARVVLKQTIGNQVTVLLDTDNATTYTFSYDTSLCNPAIYGDAVARNTSMPIALILETYDQGNFIGANYYTINVAYPLNKPVLSSVTKGFDYVTEGIDANFLAAERASGMFFDNNLTKFSFSCTATPQNYAYIQRVTIEYLTANLETITTTVYEDRTGEYTGAVSLSGSVVLGHTGDLEISDVFCTVTVTDSRGVESYIFSDGLWIHSILAPTIQNAAIQRGTYSGGTWTQDEDAGTAIRFTGTLESQSNSAVITITKNGTVFSSNTYNAGSITIYITNCPPSSNTELLVEVNNYLSQSSYQFVAPPTKPDINYNSDIHGVAFGQLAEVIKGVTIAPDWYMYNNGVPMQWGSQTSLPNVPTSEPYGRWLGFTINTAKYYLYVGSSNVLWVGTDLNGTGTITWIKTAISQALDLGSGDLNNYTNFGCYTQKWSANATAARNYPITLAGYLEVIPLPDNAYVLQRYTAYDSSSIWIRDYYNGSWSAWNCVFGLKQLVNEDLNSVTNAGHYYQAQGSRATTANHYPQAGAAGFMEVIKATDNFFMQRYTLYDGTKTWVRTYVSGWNSWVQL